MFQEVLLILILVAIIVALASVFGYHTNLAQANQLFIPTQLKQRLIEEAYKYSGMFWMAIIALAVLVLVYVITSIFN